MYAHPRGGAESGGVTLPPAPPHAGRMAAGAAKSVPAAVAKAEAAVAVRGAGPRRRIPDERAGDGSGRRRAGGGVGDGLSEGAGGEGEGGAVAEAVVGEGAVAAEPLAAEHELWRPAAGRRSGQRGGAARDGIDGVLARNVERDHGAVELWRPERRVE